MTQFARALALVLAVTVAPLPASAQAAPDDLVDARLRTGWRTSAGTQMTALDLQLAPGWKTYWRAPGEAGIPPVFDWSGSSNVGSIRVHWPTPEVFDLNGMRTIGYHDALILPIEVRPADPSQPVHLAAQIDLGICETVCVPATLHVAADLATTTRPDATIRAALDQVPASAKAAGLSDARCSEEPLRDGLRLRADLSMPRIGPAEYAVIEVAGGNVWVSPADIQRKAGMLSVTADLVPPNAKPFALDRSTVLITVFSGDGRAVEVQGCKG